MSYGFNSHQPHQWGYGEMVDAPVLETGVERRMGSTPFIPTNNKNQGGWPSPPETQRLERGTITPVHMW